MYSEKGAYAQDFHWPGVLEASHVYLITTDSGRSGPL